MPNYRKYSKEGRFRRKASPGPGDAADELVLPDGSKVDGAAIDDCAHFVSCCVGSCPGAAGGGVALSSDFPGDGVYGHLSADDLFHRLTDADGLPGDVLGDEKMTKAQGSAKLATLRAGDLVFYYDPGHGRYGHCGLYLADSQHRIACHSYIRCDVTNDPGQGWDSVGIENVKFTFVRLS